MHDIYEIDEYLMHTYKAFGKCAISASDLKPSLSQQSDLPFNLSTKHPSTEPMETEFFGPPSLSHFEYDIP